MPPARFVAAAAAFSLLAAACTDDDATPPPLPPTTTTVPEATTTTTTPRAGEGPLTIGLLLPVSPQHERHDLGESLIEGANEAVRQARSAGAEIRVERADEGQTPAEATDAIEDLIDAGVHAIIGPSSSSITLSTLGTIVDANVLACSPTASSLLLDDFPDNGRFIRTIPSDSLQARALAQRAAETGASTVAITYIDDTYGRGFLQATTGAISEQHPGLSVVSQVPVSSHHQTVRGVVEELMDESPNAVIVLADAPQGTELLLELDQFLREPANRGKMPLSGAGGGGIIVNDAMRNPEPDDALSEMSDRVRSRVQGVSPIAHPPASSPLDGLFAVNAYNCVTAITLAWESARAQPQPLNASLLSQVTSGGAPCQSYAVCRSALDDNRETNYTGPDGQLELGIHGDPTQARFDVFTFDEDGNDVSTGQSTGTVSS